MSDDIVDRYNSARLTPAPAQMLKDAIDEVVRLRAENETLRDGVRTTIQERDVLSGENWEFRAENETLRAALKPFAADTRWLDGEDDDYLCSSIWFRLGQYRAAAAALKETGDE